MTILRGTDLDCAFDGAAAAYDRLTSLSPGYHRRLAQAAARVVPDDGELRHVLDLGCGTGASTRAVLRVLRPGGRLVLHDYTLRGRRIDTLTWNALCLGVVIPLGAAGPGGPRLYRHLRRSVLRFDTVDALAARVGRAGFSDVRIHPAAGWQGGLVHTLTATNPPEQR